MEIFQIGKILGTAGLAAFFFAGCSSDSDTQVIYPNKNQSTTSSSSTSEQLTLAETELQYNYLMLDLFYFYSHSKNEISSNIKDYYQQPVLADYNGSYCALGSSYTDVCYMYSRTSDPFTRYFDPTYAEYVYEMIMGADKAVGVGAELKEVDVNGGTVLVFSQVYPKSPAAKAGIAINDTLESVAGLMPNSIETAEKLLSGNDGEILNVQIKRDEETIQATITIGEYVTPTVFLSYEDSIPVIQITEFTEKTVSDSGTYGEFIDALKKTEGAKATIIDLRNNPGGDIDQCDEISAEFLSAGDTIVMDIESDVDSTGNWFTKEYFQIFDTLTYTAQRNGMAKDRYVVFMADSGSASCAERMLSTVTVNKKSPVIGLTTYGKGIGQGVLNTYAKGLALITVLQSMDKNGNVYHKVGVVPDYESGDPDEQMAKAVEWAKTGTELRLAGYGTKSTGHFAKARATRNTFTIPQNRRELLKQLGGSISRKYK